ncbi:MAG TPA: pantoate--beta-alanine ligase [Burkholderiaceae bacterium]|nr:pantoate--beta-alanine ligase [Burkholderiaceae bacterium]
MRIEHSLAGLRAALGTGRQVGFVATMGNLHDGHLALVREARKRLGPDGLVVASIFVNRLQFGAGEDFDQYPRTLDRDAGLLREAGCDLLFAPDENVMYPQPQTFQVVPDSALAGILEGEVRPGHFAGVCTVVMKLFTMVQPTIAMFGKKDYQQLMMIRQMAQQFALPLTVVGCETVREADGLAMSSRNGYLEDAERAEASRLNRALGDLANAVRKGRASGRMDVGELARLEADAGALLSSHGWHPDYVTVRRRRDLLPPEPDELRGSEPLVALGAAKIGTPRLLDNIEI